MLFRSAFLLFFISNYVSAQHNLDQYLESIEKKAKVSLIIQDLQGNILHERNSQSIIPSASIIKIPILFTLFSQVEDGKIQLNDQYQLTHDDVVGGTGDIQHQAEGGYYSIESLAMEMIRVSDNTATNILINHLEMSSINKKMAELGLKSTQLNRLMMDFDAIAAGRQNYTSPAEINQLLLMINSSEYLSSDSRELMIEMLLNCDDNTTIPSQLPAGIAVAHKTGILDYVRADAGIIYASHPIVISIFVEDFIHTAEAEEIIGTIAKMAFENFGKRKNS